MICASADLADRWTILLLKQAHGQDVWAECYAVSEALTDRFWSDRTCVRCLGALYKTNAAIWQLESAIRQGREGEMGLVEVGRRALAIRNLNAERVTLKNQIHDLMGDGWTETKIDHASEAPRVR